MLITGGTGDIGSFINKKLFQEGFNTIILDNPSRGHREFVKWGGFYKVDIGDRELVNRKLCRP